MVGVEEAFGQQGAYVTTSESVDNALPATLTLDETGQPQLRQMLAGHCRTASCDRCQAGDVQFCVPQRPEHSHPGRVGKQREGRDRRRDLPLCREIRVFRCGRSFSGHTDS